MNNRPKRNQSKWKYLQTEMIQRKHKWHYGNGQWTNAFDFNHMCEFIFAFEN